MVVARCARLVEGSCPSSPLLFNTNQRQQGAREVIPQEVANILYALRVGYKIGHSSGAVGQELGTDEKIELSLMQTAWNIYNYKEQEGDE